MNDQSDTKRLRGGRWPSQRLIACHLFGPLLLDESRRYRYRMAQTAKEENITASDGSQLEQCRFSYKSLSDMIHFRLPEQLTIDTPKATFTKKRNAQVLGYDCHFRSPMLFELDRILINGATGSAGRIRSGVETEDDRRLWDAFLLDTYGSAYVGHPSYRALIANLSTMAAGICLFLYQGWGGYTQQLLASAPRFMSEMDGFAISQIASEANVSTGVVVATIIQLGSKKGSGPVLAALRASNWEPLHDALWGPILHDYQSHPFYRDQYLAKIEQKDVRAARGRPSRRLFLPPDAPEPPLPSPAQAETQVAIPSIVAQSPATDPIAEPTTADSGLIEQPTKQFEQDSALVRVPGVGGPISGNSTPPPAKRVPIFGKPIQQIY